MAQLETKTYRVVGPLRVHATRPGAQFTAVLDPGQEAFLLAVGHIAVVPEKDDATNGGVGSASTDQKEKA